MLLSQTAYEGFSYTAGSLLNGQNGGTGAWNSTWAEYTNFNGEKVNDTISATSLSYASGIHTLLTSGGALSSTGITSDDVRSFTSGATVVYISFLMRHDTVGSPVPQDYGGLTIDGTLGGGSSYFVGDPGASDFISAGIAGSDASLVQSTTTLNLGSVVFLVARITINAMNNNDPLRLYINPVPGSSEASNTNFINKNGLDIGTAVTGVEFISGTNANWTFDELRVGTTFEDVVTEVPPPATTGVAASDGTFSDKAQVTWTANPTATGYDVWRSTGNNSSLATKLNSSSITGTSYDDTTAVGGTVYWYWVAGTNTGGSGPLGTADAGYRAPAQAGSFTFVSAGSTDPFYLILDAGGTNLQVSFATTALSTPSYQIPVAQLTSLQMTLNGTANKVIVDYSHGSPVPSGGINVVGVPAVQDELHVIGLNLSDTFVMSDTQIGRSGGNNISYQNIATMTLEKMYVYGTGTLSTLQNLNIMAGTYFYWGPPPSGPSTGHRSNGGRRVLLIRRSSLRRVLPCSLIRRRYWLLPARL